MQKGYDLYPSEYNFKYFTRLQSACSYQGKLQTNYAVLTFCDFKHTYCYIASAETKRDWLIHGHVALDKCNVSLG